MKPTLRRIITPYPFDNLVINLGIAVPRVWGGLSLCLEFGSSKFGMPWSITEEMGLFQVVQWFPEDVSQFGIPFSLAPNLFAWLGAASEAIGGLFLALGLGTRISAFLIAMTMLAAIFLQKWPEAMEFGSSWPFLPAAGFLWIAVYSLIFGSGKFGLDHLLAKRWE
ncbi:DoxX family protein [Flagellimonas flava]|uniref:Putative oxidoreductase n=1 Tax=Flagellimonas flava TaxID=570519 RepID=A0A1M5PVS7_9FLAO|nr:DoxX family protein [Allomuricauda flava]SHH05746.1 putative oxidoreductase [Allomuricauda flava]